MIEIKEEFKYRFEKALALKGMKPADIARATNISEATISQYRSGYSKPKDKRLALIASKLNVNPAWLMGMDVPMEVQHEKAKGTWIPVLGRVAAGIPIDAIEEVIDQEEITYDMSKRGSYFGLRVKGDSMSPLILDGDTAICREQPDADNDDIVIAIIDGKDGVCKRLKKLSDGIMLISNNAAYNPMVFTRSEVDSMPVRIVAKVEEIRRKI